MASLKEILAALKRGAEGDGVTPGRIPPPALQIMHRVTADQRASGYRARMPATGATAPTFALANQDGATVSSADLLKRGAYVLSFFRGRW